MARAVLVSACLIVSFAQVGAMRGQAPARPQFEVASIKPSPPGAFRSPSFPLDNGEAFRPTGNLFSAVFPLTTYITFAWKIRPTKEEMQSMLSALPKWVSTDAYDIQARAQGTPTKDQFRLMMQSLLAERFRLVVHFETRDIPVFTMTLVNPGKTGPNLRPHDEGPACDAPGGPNIIPDICDVQMLIATREGMRAASRNTTIDVIAASFPLPGNLGRPVLDRTGLTGKYDYKLDWTPDPNDMPGVRRPDFDPTAPGPTFLQALHYQLGLKLEPGRGPIRSLVIDHVERPSEN